MSTIFSVWQMFASKNATKLKHGQDYVTATERYTTYILHLDTYYIKGSCVKNHSNIDIKPFSIFLKIVYSSKVMEFPGKVFYRGISLSTFCPRSCRRWRWKLSPEIEDSLLIFVNFRYTRVLGAYSSSNSRHVVRARRALKFIVLFDRDSMRSCKWLSFCYWCCCYSCIKPQYFLGKVVNLNEIKNYIVKSNWIFAIFD